MRKAVAVLALALSGCVAMTPIVASQPVALSSGQIAQIKSAATKDFFDPASAQFRDVRAVDLMLTDGTQERRVCGEVNGKNRMGGYVGFQMFGGKIIGGRFVRVDFFGLCD